MRRFLRYIRVEDHNGVLSLTTLALGIGIAFLFFGWVIPFLAGCLLYAVKKVIIHSHTYLAMEGAQEAGIVQMQQAHEAEKTARADALAAMAKKLEALGGKIQELAQPERDEALRRIRGGGGKA